MSQVLLSPFEWALNASVCLILAILTLILIKNEIKTRREPNIKFTTPFLQYTSLSCIVSGFLVYIFLLFTYLKGICKFNRFVATIFIYIEMVSMGFYQLSRLYYCYANDQIHSNKGYPKWLFIIMTIAGFLILINGPLSHLLSHNVGLLRSECGFNANFEYYFTTFDLTDFDGFLWYVITNLVYNVWDISTVLLYAIKIRLFRKYQKTQPMVYERVMSILYKIFILSIFYEIINFLCIPVMIIMYFIGIDTLNLMVLIAPFNVAFVMYLMMDYNHKKYVKFLNFMHKYKFYLCYCCCRYMVIKQLEDEEAKIVVHSLEVNCHKKTEKSYDTTVKQEGIQSIDTTISTTVECV